MISYSRLFQCLRFVCSLVLCICILPGLGFASETGVVLDENSFDEGLPAYKIETPSAVWFLEKSGAGLSSMIDPDGNDWINFCPQQGSGTSGEYRGIPNAVHLQAGSFFHPRNAATGASTTRIEHADGQRVTISAASENGLWACRYDFFPTHCTMTMTQMPPGKRYWILYEGTPGGALDNTDWWMTTHIHEPQPIAKKHSGDIPGQEWIVFGDAQQERVLYLMNHEDDSSPDNYYPMEGEMTVFGFGRAGGEKYLSTVPSQFSFGFLDSTNHHSIKQAIREIPEVDSRASLDVSSNFPPTGYFALYRRMELGFEHGNPKYSQQENCFRVNSPGVSLDKSIKDRHETRYNGLMMIRADCDVTSLAGATVDLEVWGGHPGTYNKRMTINGRSTYGLPEVGSETQNCTHSYPTIPLKLSDLVNGYNAFQFACDKVEGWGHFILYEACLKLRLPSNHTKLKSLGLANFTAAVEAITSEEEPDEIALSLKLPPGAMDQIARVDYQAFYDGYDENGNGATRDWHGMTHRGEPIAYAGSSASPTFRCLWDTSMLPSQDDISVRASITMKDAADLVYTTPPTHNLTIPEREQTEVVLVSSEEVPRPFWSRAGNKKVCEIQFPYDPEQIENAVLQVAAWGRNHGTIEDYFTLNEHLVPLGEIADQGPIYYEGQAPRSVLCWPHR